MKLRAITKAAVSAVTSLFGSNTGQLTRPVTGGLFGWVREPFAGAWQLGGPQIDPLGALTAYAAVYACVSRIANDVGKLCPELRVRESDGTWQLAPDNSPHWKTLRKPNHFQNRIQFYVYWIICKLLHGNAYALKVRDERTMVSRMYLLDPRRVCPMVAPNGDVYYNLGNDDLAGIPAGMMVPASEIIHDRMNCLWHPLVGISPIYACGISATQGLRIQSNSSAFFTNMSRPSGMLTAPGTIDEPTADRLKKEWDANFSGQNLGKLAVLGDGLKYEPMTIPAQMAQLIEQLKWTVEDVARAFGVPLYKINAGTVPAGAPVESLNQQYYDECLQIHIESIESCLDEGLAVPGGTRVEFDLAGLLRMDQTAHMKMLGEGVKNGVMTPNEARKERNLRPVEGGNTIYMQEQNFSLEALAKRDAKEDPFGSAAPPAPAVTPEPADDAPDDEAGAAKAMTAQFIRDLDDVVKSLPSLHEDTEAAHA